jgi:phospho-N-acetylmuramoyl-pentapeptide-transferase
MIYYLYEWLEESNIPGIGMLQYISFRSGAAVILSLILSTAFGRQIIRILKAKQIGEEIRDLGLEHQAHKQGTLQWAD